MAAKGTARVTMSTTDKIVTKMKNAGALLGGNQSNAVTAAIEAYIAKLEKKHGDLSKKPKKGGKADKADKADKSKKSDKKADKKSDKTSKKSKKGKK